MHWLEMLRSAPPEPGLSRDREPLLIAERDGYPLGSAWSRMPKEMRPRFPMLERVSTSFVAQNDERLLLSPDDVQQVLAEFSRVLSLCSFETCEGGLDSKAFFERWKADCERWTPLAPDDEFQVEIEKIAAFLQEAFDKDAWIYIWH
jgi:hypothetical protein